MFKSPDNRTDKGIRMDALGNFFSGNPFLMISIKISLLRTVKAKAGVL
jgi:hypothetical protein